MIPKSKLTTKKETPMMRQYLDIKKRHPQEILFFRMGDFYEMFLEDAVYASRILDIALTKRQDKVPMCGIPYHALNNYVHPILDSGRNIAICEQVEDPKTVKGRIVKRDVTRILTPGSVFEEDLLQNDDNRLLASLFIKSSNQSTQKIFMVSADLSTGEIKTIETGLLELGGWIAASGIKEIILEENTIDEEILDSFNVNIAADVKFVFRKSSLKNKESIEKNLQSIFQLKNIDLLEIENNSLKTIVLLFDYIKEIAPMLKIKWQIPKKVSTQKRMQLDDAALKTLEILTSQNGGKLGSLFQVLDHTSTSMGRRMLSDYLAHPSSDIEEINNRLDTVEFFFNLNKQNKDIIEQIKQNLNECFDIDRIINSLYNSSGNTGVTTTSKSGQVRHLGNIYYSLKSIKSIIHLLNSFNSVLPTEGEQHTIKNNSTSETSSINLPTLLKNKWTENDFPEELYSLLEEALYLEDLPPLLDERRFINKGYSESLDELFELATSAQKFLLEFEQKERKKYGISTLKIKYNRVIGYFIEISKGLVDKAPDCYIRRQTLVNGERYTTEELKELEDKIMNAKEEVLHVQRAFFDDIREQILAQTDSLRAWSKRIAEIDTFQSLSQAAIINKYVRPIMTDSSKSELSLKNSRHPVVEAIFKEEVFIPNDVFLNNSDKHLAILTGPNMAGKSTYIRQVGLIQIMAQAGSFIPADVGYIPIADRVFTRIGAYDRLFQGQSTFFVEMLECAKIFRHFTDKSLILMDEVGRGTSTYDGISISRAMIEYLNESSNSTKNTSAKPKTLFATHYTELAEMIDEEKGIFGLHVKVIEENNKIIFLRRIVEGVADRSYGIYVADLAGLPEAIITKADAFLKELEGKGLWGKEVEKSSEKDTSTGSVTSSSYNKPSAKKEIKSVKKDFLEKNQLTMF